MTDSEPHDPGGRAAAAAQNGRHLRHHVEAIFESVIGSRLHDPKQIGRTDALDHVGGDAPLGLGLFGARADKCRDLTRPRQKIRHAWT